MNLLVTAMCMSPIMDAHSSPYPFLLLPNNEQATPMFQSCQLNDPWRMVLALACRVNLGSHVLGSDDISILTYA